jgi:hypothetical protein
MRRALGLGDLHSLGDELDGVGAEAFFKDESAVVCAVKALGSYYACLSAFGTLALVVRNMFQNGCVGYDVIAAAHYDERRDAHCLKVAAPNLIPMPNEWSLQSIYDEKFCLDERYEGPHRHEWWWPAVVVNFSPFGHHGRRVATLFVFLEQLGRIILVEPSVCNIA